MRTKVLLGLAVAVMLIVSVATIGSNMGFKISIPLYKNGTGHTGLNWVALPYYAGYVSASAVWTDIAAISGVTGVEVDQYQESDGTYLAYDPDSFLTDDFPITSSGQLINAGAILVKVVTSGTSVNWIVVGSHSPSLALTLRANGTGHTGLNWCSIPYHTTAADAQTLWTQISAIAPNTSSVEIDQYQETDGTYLAYDPDSFLTDNFSIKPGTALLVKVSANKSWTPAHY
jgi:hypothetical protein